MARSQQTHYTEADWNRIRSGFSMSIMVDTHLCSLAQNLEMRDWPLMGADETPSKYIEFNWDELQQLKAFKADATLLQHLCAILSETLSFDEPFQDMVDQQQKSVDNELPALKTLQKLGIPEGYPISLTALSKDAREFCAAQGLSTLGEYTRMAQKISQLVIMEGDFRAFLNSLAHTDEREIARFVPFRIGAKGLYFAESVGLLLRSLPESQLYAYAKLAGAKLPPDLATKAQSVSKDTLAQLETQLRHQLLERIQWFKDEMKQWTTPGVDLERHFRPLGDPVLERCAILLTSRYLGKASAEPSPAPGKSPNATGNKPGLWDKILSLFRR